jgi:hypothetical protein
LATSVAFFRDTPEKQLTGIGGLNSITGGTFPARIWNVYMRKALAEYPLSFFPRPAFVGGTQNIYIDVAKPTPTPTLTRPEPNPTLFKPKPVPMNSSTPLPISSSKPLPSNSNKPVPVPSAKPIPEGSVKPIPGFSPKPIP